MNASTLESSPRRYARFGGALYLLIIVLGGYAEAFVRGSLIVYRDAGATARNIAAATGLWHLGVASELVVVLSALALAVIEFGLLRPVGRYLASVSLAINLVSIGLEALDKVLLLLVPSILSGGKGLTVFTAEQREGLAYLFLEAHGITFHLSLLVFGVVCLISGHLIARAGYLPRALGLLFQLGGACYVVASTATLFFPVIGAQLFPFILIPPFLGELSMALWLLVKGVDLPKWRERVARAAP